MGEIFTSGVWIAKEGKGEDFVAAWTEMAEWTGREVPGSSWALLLRDASDPRRFLSVGPWESMKAVEGWRASEGFQQRVGRIRELLESFEPSVLERAAGAPPGQA